LKSENYQTKRHRGSSPPFQDIRQGVLDFLNDSHSIGQDSDNTSETQVQKQQRYKNGKTVDQELDLPKIKHIKTERQSIDDGGESG